MQLSISLALVGVVCAILAASCGFAVELIVVLAVGAIAIGACRFAHRDDPPTPPLRTTRVARMASNLSCARARPPASTQDAQLRRVRLKAIVNDPLVDPLHEHVLDAELERQRGLRRRQPSMADYQCARTAYKRSVQKELERTPDPAIVPLNQ